MLTNTTLNRSGWGEGGGGGYSEKNWAGVCGSLPKTPTLFMTKMRDFPYLIYDLSKNLKPYLDLFQSCVIILLSFRPTLNYCKHNL